MKEKEKIRLNKVLRELNISLDKAVEFLSLFDYNIEARPTTKIDKQQYEFLKYKFKKGNLVENKVNKKPLSSITKISTINKIRDQKGIPSSIFKYYNLNDYHFESIEKKYLYYSKPSDFNDPFDCSIQLISFINENSKDKIRHKKKEKKFSEKLNNIGICCFSRTKDSTLMWSHYANSHKGFCVEYKTNKNIQSINPLDVNYISEFKKANYFEKASDAIFHLIYSKSIDWKYEQELRSLKTNFNEDKQRKIPFKESDIIAIYFGIKTEQTTVNKIMKITKKFEKQNIKFYKGNRNETNFEINWKEIKN